MARKGGNAYSAELSALGNHLLFAAKGIFYKAAQALATRCSAQTPSPRLDAPIDAHDSVSDCFFVC